MSTTSVRKRQIAESLKDKEYRDLYVGANIRQGIAFQIRAMRQDRGWTQSELAVRTGTKQEVISKLEDPSYGRFTIKTLGRLASAFDVALFVKFVSFSRLVNELAGLSPSDLAVPGFDDDRELTRGTFADFLPDASTDAQLVAHVETQLDEPMDASKVLYMSEYRPRACTAPSHLELEYGETAEGY